MCFFFFWQDGKNCTGKQWEEKWGPLISPQHNEADGFSQLDSPGRKWNTRPSCTESHTPDNIYGNGKTGSRNYSSKEISNARLKSWYNSGRDMDRIWELTSKIGLKKDENFDPAHTGQYYELIQLLLQPLLHFCIKILLFSKQSHVRFFFSPQWTVTTPVSSCHGFHDKYWGWICHFLSGDLSNPGGFQCLFYTAISSLSLRHGEMALGSNLSSFSRLKTTELKY